MSTETERKVDPELLPGFLDHSPKQMNAKQWMIGTIRRVFESFGFEPLDTSTVEFMDVLFGPDESTDMSYFGVRRKGRPEVDRELAIPNQKRTALRYDLTISLARYVAANIATIPRPFLRYQIGEVFRGEKPREGRFCEFTQFDADIVFAPDLWADAQIIALMYETMVALGVTDFVININNRKFCNGLPAFAGFSEEKLVDVLRVLDKWDKIGRAGIETELKQNETLCLSTETVGKLLAILQLNGNNEERLAQAQQLFGENPKGQEGLEELATLLEYVKALGVPAEYVSVAFHVVRNLNYYTGPVFETVLTKCPEIGSVFSGGRFDGLVSRFANIKAPAVGASVGVDRLLVGLEKLGLLEEKKSVAQVLVTVMDRNQVSKYLEIAQRLRKIGFNVLVYTGTQTTMKVQLIRAVTEEIPWVIIVGADELAKGQISIKDTRTRKQVTIPDADLEKFFAGYPVT